ncbi:hypothetical protein N3K66_007976 [Trichothecium roseum]|uniref:Uncharacterized protein n=1 Tax=Trichothecium roseum TaxID=47278 RepID=A0ACC0UTW6_9HYPO|nr:hypothetical protein N3K66_007976 [Trichothecium roseum]
MGNSAKRFDLSSFSCDDADVEYEVPRTFTPPVPKGKWQAARDGDGDGDDIVYEHWLVLVHHKGTLLDPASCQPYAGPPPGPDIVFHAAHHAVARCMWFNYIRLMSPHPGSPAAPTAEDRNLWPLGLIVTLQQHVLTYRQEHARRDAPWVRAFYDDAFCLLGEIHRWVRDDGRGFYLCHLEDYLRGHRSAYGDLRAWQRSVGIDAHWAYERRRPGERMAGYYARMEY